MTLLDGDLKLSPDAADVPIDELIEMACREHLGVWTEQRRGLENSALHWEWAELAMTQRRLAVVAPRDHAKSETFTVNQLAWRIENNPGIQCVAFTSERELAKELKARVDDAVGQSKPELLMTASEQNSRKTVYGNSAQLIVRTTGQKVRGLHPDIIVGDDVLEEGNTLTHYQRKKVERWWFGTVEGMGHPGTWRVVGGRKVWFRPTIIHLVGTPFHQSDLLMGMRTNPVYRFRRYAAEFDPGDLVPGTMAVEVL